jgi:hypothetical protein
LDNFLKPIVFLEGFKIQVWRLKIHSRYNKDMQKALTPSLDSQMTDLARLPSPHLTSPGSSSHAPHLSVRHEKHVGCGQGCTSLTAGHSTPFLLAATFTSRSRSLKPCAGVSTEMSTQLCGLQMLHSDHGPTSQSRGHGISHLKYTPFYCKSHILQKFNKPLHSWEGIECAAQVCCNRFVTLGFDARQSSQLHASSACNR